MKINTSSEQLDVEVIMPSPVCAPSMLFLHGAGTSNKGRARYIADDLAARGLSSVLFDFSGQGASSGEMHQSSLLKREEEARVVLQNVRLSMPYSIIGSSMGAYTAIALAPDEQPKSLILFCPAVYDRKVYALPFDSRFSEGIRRPGSWRDSDAFEDLSRYTGQLLVVIGSEDRVIPTGLTDLLLTSASNTRRNDLLVIKGADHQIHAWLQTHEADRLSVMDRIASFLS
jgi:hypothetical protein